MFVDEAKLSLLVFDSWKRFKWEKSFPIGNLDFMHSVSVKDGNTLWHADAVVEMVPDILKTKEGHFLLVHNTSIRGRERSGMNDIDISVRKLDSEGETIWKHHYGAADILEWGVAAHQTGDGGFFIVGLQPGEENEKECLQFQNCLLKIDGDGDQTS